ncbi:MAG TPA: beta-L-arabinofuranosidase domain-containing protein [Blastocatellia bacterium]|nr:beta-L-arabinofuranosidase domain-containing protein [Blastocatellia bacterium]
MFYVALCSAVAYGQKSSDGIVKNRRPLAPNALYPLPLTSVKPQGWLRRQLRIQADGLSGHLDEFWPDLGPDSGWLGGAGESWERGPYFLDGLVPLAYLLDDAKLIAKANKWVDWTLSNQRPDGSIGPERNKDWWPNMVMLKVLTQFYEATGDPRVIPLMKRYFQYHARHLSERPLKEWASYRWGDELLSVLWLYNRAGDARLLDFARALKRQGFDWKSHFINFEFTTKTSKEQLGLRPDMSNTTEKSMRAHGVNNAMALKYAALWWLISRDASDRNAIYQILRMLDKYHPLPNGMYSGDEHYAGPNPTQGIELCAVVEAMFSLEHVIAILGDPAFGDRLEKISYNALPATFSKDMWAHQYDQQPNQVLCSIHPREWTTNGPESNIFGLEPNFGCCTANMHQGWPKLAASLWMATPDDGLAAIVYAPCEVKTVVNGVRVRISEETEYPFRETIQFTINPDTPVTFPLKLRIPAWARQAVLTVNGGRLAGTRAGEFYTVTRRWKKGDRATLTLPMRVRVTRGYQDSVTLERGPLVYSLRIGEDWRKLDKGMRRPAKPPAADWEVHPTTAWNYAIKINAARPEESAQVVEKAVGEYPFSADGAPVELRVQGRRLPEWTVVKGSAGPLPKSPVASREPEETLTLIPYGAAKLRITAFPQVSEP